jgi:DNA mismatch endonuclease (patch repair protein)
MPATNIDSWHKKFARTVARDAQHKAALENIGWRVVVVWECELRNLAALQARLFDYFSVSRIDGVDYL